MRLKDYIIKNKTANTNFKCCYEIVVLKEKIKKKIKDNLEIANEWFYQDKLVANDALKENDALQFVLMLMESLDDES